MKARGVTGSLFEEGEAGLRMKEPLAAGAFVLRGFALDHESELRRAIDDVVEQAPLRHMTTPGGYLMSVAMTNCGDFGWISDRRGYRYDRLDPNTGAPWPALPGIFLDLAARAAEAAGYQAFLPDACLINRYEPGARLSLHQDRNEKDMSAPIVSVSLGLPAAFLFGGDLRSDPSRRVPVFHGDVAVWGGASRLAFHGISPLKEGRHQTMGRQRINLTLRRAR